MEKLFFGTNQHLFGQGKKEKKKFGPPLQKIFFASRHIQNLPSIFFKKRKNRTLSKKNVGPFPKKDYGPKKICPIKKIFLRPPHKNVAKKMPPPHEFFWDLLRKKIITNFF